LFLQVSRIALLSAGIDPVGTFSHYGALSAAQYAESLRISSVVIAESIAGG